MTTPPLLVKIGGSLTDVGPVADDLAAHDGPVVVVHGAHRILDDLSARLGHPPRVVTSPTGATSRFTDSLAMDHFLMAYCGVANKRLVQLLLARGVDAVGLAALDGGMVRARRRPDIRTREAGRTVVLHGDHAGSIERVDPSLLRALLDQSRMPVICPPAAGADGTPLNVDGDRLAAELAVALGASVLLVLSDTSGLLADPADPSSTVRDPRPEQIAELASLAGGRARAKLAALERALRGGVSAVGWCDGRSAEPLRSALAGAGTWWRSTTPAAVAAP